MQQIFMEQQIMPRPIVVHEGLWAGTETALMTYLKRLEGHDALIAAGKMEAALTVGGSQYEQPLPYLLSVDDGIAIVNVKGPTTNQVSHWDRYDSAATYTAIREAMIHAATMPEVTAILMDIDSGGGSVAGLSDIGALITQIDQTVKPVYAFTDGNMYSAAYWIGSCAREVFASKVAGVGSIGIIATHMELSKSLEASGVTVNVIRSGKYKALVNRYEKLTDAAREQLQENLDAAYEVFVTQVAESRGVPYAQADKKMADGREFFGEQAVTAGLVDGIETFDTLMSKLKAKSVDSKQSFSHNPQNVTKGNIMPKKALSAQEIAAIAAGASLADATAASASNPAVEDTTTEPTAEEAAAAAAQAAASAAAAEGGVSAPAATTPAVADAGVLAFLQGQIKEKDAALVSAAVELQGLRTSAADMEAARNGLFAIAAASVNNMRIAMGGSAIDMSAMTATALLAEHASYAAQFGAKFKAGGLAAVDTKPQDKPKPVVLSASAQARLDSTRIHSNRKG